jgi:hypothetical protein
LLCLHSQFLHFSLEAERRQLLNKVRNIEQYSFDAICEEVFEYQLKYNKVYSEYVSFYSNPMKPVFLPISAFKNQAVIINDLSYESYFESSGTTSSFNSKHYINDIDWYLENCKKGFETFYGDVSRYCILALLPHYQERKNSSLIAMVDSFISVSNRKSSGFFLYNHEALYDQLLLNKINNIPTILFGVSFALLDFAENFKIDFPSLIVMETGGMKGRRQEVTREDLHLQLSMAFNTNAVHSEYGMTELLSQAYSRNDGIFIPPKTMKVIITEISDPLSNEKQGKTGSINIIDLANLDSCSFIATEDLGIGYKDGSFKIVGRLDQSDIRGCNLMVGDI